MVENSKIGRIIFFRIRSSTGYKISENLDRISARRKLCGDSVPCVFGRMHWSVWVAGLGCGIVFLMISKWSQEGIGYGDSWMILNMGIFLGIWNLLGMLMLAFLVAAMAAGAGLWSGKWKRTTRMSFYPFLLIGYLGTFIW